MSDAAFTEAVQEVKGSFDLGAFVKGRPQRYKTVRVFTDEETGERLGGVEDEVNETLGIVTGKHRWGVLGEADELAETAKNLQARIDGGHDADGLAAAELEKVGARIKELGLEAADLIDKLNETALDIEVQSLPPIIKKDARRRAKAALEIKGNIPQDRYEEFMEEYNAQILSLATVSITKVATGEKNIGLDVEGAKNLFDFLPDSEAARLDEFVAEIVFKSVIAKKVATDADF